MKLNEQDRGTLIALLLLLLVFFGYVFQQSKENKLYSNLRTTIGKVTGIKHVGKGRAYIQFVFVNKGRIIKGSDPLRASWPEFVRDGKVQVNRYYPVEFDSTDPTNSKIVIKKILIQKLVY